MGRDAADGERRRRLVLGLGNPGRRYADTRHNVGFRVVEEIARRRGLRLGPGECNCLASYDKTVFLAMPQTYMNRSGYAVRCLRERRGFEPQDLLVVYDEIQLPLGKLRVRRRGSPAGHRGMESVLENLGTDQVPRLRLGVGGGEGPPAGEDIVDFVLSPFAREEHETVEEMITLAAEACETWVRQGVDAAMQQFNG